MTNTPTRNETKSFVLDKLLHDSHSVFVYLDARKDGVWVPKFLRNNPQLVLQLGLNLVIPLHDFKTTPTGWSATLSFNRQAFYCSVPWEAVYLIVNEDGMGAVWPEDAPPGVDIPGREKPAAGFATPVSKTETRKTLPPSWRVIEGGKTGAEDGRPKAG